MNNLKILGLAAIAAMALMASNAASASATTLEVGGVNQNGAVTIEMSLKSGTSLIWSRTDGSLGNTCTGSTVKGTTNVFTGGTVSAPVSGLSYTSCERSVTVDEKGSLFFASISGTPDGTVSSTGTFVTVGSIFGTLPCKTGGGVDIGRLTGSASGHAELHINAVLGCGFPVPSASWKGTYVVTSPTGLSVTE